MPDPSARSATEVPDAPRPLRADAERNRQLVLAAARRAFADHGLGVRLDEIAAIAGVGVGTVYRRFKDKDALVAALFDEQIESIVAIADEALATRADGSGLRLFYEQVVAAMAADRGFQQILIGLHGSAEQISARARERIEPRVTELLRRAQAAGRVRADLAPGDLPILQVILSTIVDATALAGPDLHRRYTQLLLDALEPRPGDEPLPAAPTREDGIAVIEGWMPSPRRPGARG